MLLLVLFFSPREEGMPRHFVSKQGSTASKDMTPTRRHGSQNCQEEEQHNDQGGRRSMIPGPSLLTCWAHTFFYKETCNRQCVARLGEFGSTFRYFAGVETLVGCLAGRLADWLVGWLAACLTMADWLAGWLAGWLVGFIAGYQLIWLANWLAS
jgi:hypothetical protein